ncbi:cytochrome c [Rhodobacter sp. Har01]|uniref:c-type cytochrome n=1 Tax=Rhodobacter sp. Har01 TaxID=2883999 RepID=UPI001D083225|nr:cytochrome c [Rhodobacter sp. Har01]MCB6177744.1 cytochrome c [Rhodobacter sp. Har01]
MKFTKLVLVGALLAAGAAFAEGEATDPAAKAREAVMQAVGMNVGTLGKMAKGEMPYDAAAAEAAKAAIVTAAGGIAAAFEAQGGEDPTSEAKPEIWANWDDFLKNADALKVAAEGADVSSAEAIGASMGTLGGACKDCHTDYRNMKM